MELTYGTPMEQWRELFIQAERLKKLKPWEWMSDSDIFAVQDSESGVTGYVSILGQAGELFGLACHRGNEGLNVLHRLLSGAFSPDDMNAIYHQDSLLLSFENRNELEKEDYELIKNLGLTFRGRHQWPSFRSYRPGYYPWILEPDEVLFFTRVIEQSADICSRLREDPSLLQKAGPNRFFGVCSERSGENVAWHDVYVSAKPAASKQEKIPLLVDDFTLRRLKNNMAKRPAVLEFDCFYGPEPIQEHKEQRPFFPYIALWIDQSEEIILDYAAMGREDGPDVIQKQFVGLVEKWGWVPSSIKVQSEESYHILHPVAEKLGVNVSRVPTLPLLQEAKESMFHHLMNM